MGAAGLPSVPPTPPSLSCSRRGEGGAVACGSLCTLRSSACGPAPPPPSPQPHTCALLPAGGAQPPVTLLQPIRCLENGALIPHPRSPAGFPRGGFLLLVPCWPGTGAAWLYSALGYPTAREQMPVPVPASRARGRSAWASPRGVGVSPREPPALARTQPWELLRDGPPPPPGGEWGVSLGRRCQNPGLARGARRVSPPLGVVRAQGIAGNSPEMKPTSTQRAEGTRCPPPALLGAHTTWGSPARQRAP